MQALIFDVDDTLYDQIIPFKQAAAKNFTFPTNQLEALYLSFRKHSDELFHASETGELPLNEMRVLRIQRACKEFSLVMTKAQAEQFQEDYVYFQNRIKLTEGMRKVLDYCFTQNIPMGVITNGPTEHQWRKVQQLGLTNWIPEENIFISGEVGVAKPHKEIFQLAAERLDMSSSQIIYLGDSYSNDVIGAKNAGWQVIWLQRRSQGVTESCTREDYCLTKDRDVLTLIKEIVSKR